MSTIEQEYAYKPRWTVILLGALGFGACAVVLGIKAHTNDRGVRLFRLIELPEQGATVLYWVLCVLAGGFVLAAALGSVRRMTRPQRIAFTATAILVPKSPWSSEEVAVNYATITRLSLTPGSGQRVLKVTHAHGQFTIAATLLPTRQAFEEVHELLEERTQQARQ
jgi:hypothetical protein